jgi:hypothetical protein
MRWLAALALLVGAQGAFAGGPLNVAGVSGFQPGLAGTPVTWANGQVTYYTDQGDLSPLLPNAEANQLVAEAFLQWTSIQTAAVLASRAGSLNEDVNGTNVTVINGTLTMPADLRVDSGRPLAIVYDADGLVFDALLGLGAGAPEMCSTNSVYSLLDKIADEARIVHAMVFINGNCARTSAQVTVLRYRLVRALGQVLGLDYSQVNENVVSGSPAPTTEDLAGFPVMQPLGVLCNEGGCQANSQVPRMDDRAALSRLYPVTEQNIGGLAGKQLFRENTVRISGTVRFARWNGIPGQGMQGTNVVARLVDPLTGRASRRYAASCVSGFLFRGNAGNVFTGFNDIHGRRLDRYGSADPALEGFFDLSGLEVPNGDTTATYELSVEELNPLYTDSTSVGPYKKSAVVLSGNFQPIRITIVRGGEVTQDIEMSGSASEPADLLEPSSFALPATMSATGTWTGSISGYGDLDVVLFQARANRSFTFDVTSLDARNAATTVKLEPTIGIWYPEESFELPHYLDAVFNSAQMGTTRLQGTFVANGDYKLGILDARGDGRPDFLYRARLLYADDIIPARANVKGGTSIRINGLGFSPTTQVMIGATAITPTMITPNSLTFVSPPLADAAYSVVAIDTVTGATSQMENVLWVGAALSKVVLISGSNPQVPVGTVAPNPIRVRVVDVYDGSVVPGATVTVSVPASVELVGCDQSPCAFFTDQSGTVDIRVLVKAAGPSIITASVADGISVQATVNGILAPLEISTATPAIYISAGASATVPIAATVVVSGIPAPSKTVNFLLNSGSATISPASATTDENGVASSTVSINQIASDVNISACVAPGNAPCRTIVIHAVLGTNLFLRQISGNGQTIRIGEQFAPITVRVEEATGRAVAGVPVTFHVDVYRIGVATEREQHGDGIITRRDQPVILRVFSSSVVSDANGMVTLSPFSGEKEPVRVVIRVEAGESETTLTSNSVWGQASGPS